VGPKRQLSIFFTGCKGPGPVLPLSDIIKAS
jgi:hypothetical protein